MQVTSINAERLQFVYAADSYNEHIISSSYRQDINILQFCRRQK